MAAKRDIDKFYSEMDALRDDVKRIDYDYETEGLQLYQIYQLKKHSETLGKLTICLLGVTCVLVVLTAILIYQTSMAYR